MKKVFLFLVFFFVCLYFCSCNATRSVTTTAETFTRGDTVVHITTRTIESYDGSLKPRIY